MLDAGNNELAEIQQELQAVKAALRADSSYLGLKGETLQRYLLQLNEKENLFLSRHLAIAQAAQAAAAAVCAGGRFAAGPLAPARPPPAGPVHVLDREDGEAVVRHLCDYEASAAEAAKGLRALSALAYRDAAKVGGDATALQQLLRLLALHPEDSNVRLRGMQAICNMAYDSSVSMTKLSVPGILGAVLAVFSTAPLPDPKDQSVPSGPAAEACLKAGEAAARIVAAELGSGPEASAPAKRAPGNDGPLAMLILTASGGELAWKEAMPKLLAQLVENEVTEPGIIAERFVVAGNAAAGGGPQVAVGWLTISKILANAENKVPSLPSALVEAGCINAAARLMERMPGEALVQLAGLEAMSLLVGNRWTGLTAFAEVGGIPLIEAAMGAHGGHAVLQTKGIRALGSGVLWPLDVQQKARYDSCRGITLTKTAMRRHQDSEELCQAGLEALSKYVSKSMRKFEVAEGDGTGIVEAIMGRYASNPQIQQLGRSVLEGLSL
mmetsp:Transcript_117761/g.375416  ORF Transcript_117761/g.375416 Transcript_117761/m.375416 type:complete len:497 (-) Transcript_117761:206-1696(-)